MIAKFYISIRISVKFVPNGFIDNKSAWCQTGDKPLFEPMLAQCTGAYMRH